MTPYCYGVCKMLFGECSGRVGNLLDASLTYQIVALRYPRNLTFGATAAWRATLVYEQTGRGHYSTPFLKSLARHFADLFVDKEVLRLRNKLGGMLSETDPYRLALRRSSESEARLRRHDASDVTQQSQEHLLRLLNDMLAVPDEYPHWYEHVETIMFGATTGDLREGTPFEIPPTTFEPVLNTSDDWGKLRPREKQKLLQMFTAKYPQRYRQMLQAYFRNLSKAETKAAREKP
jgi:hypothetical protein